MIFPPESVYEFRRELAAKMATGALTNAEAFRQALAVDPHDPAATRFLALATEKDGDRVLAAQPVSYTHLDVYKRQGLLPCEERFCVPG